MGIVWPAVFYKIGEGAVLLAQPKAISESDTDALGQLSLFTYADEHRNACIIVGHADSRCSSESEGNALLP